MRVTALSCLALLVVALILSPFLWGISLSLRPPLLTFAGSGMGLPLIDFEPTMEAWRRFLVERDAGPAIVRSAVVSLFSMLSALVVGAPAAYALARAVPKARSDLFVIAFILVRLMPPLLMALPLYVVFQRLQLLDGGLGLVLINTALLLPFVIAIMRQAFIDLPVSLEEAARLDGASAMQMFCYVVLPLTAPALAATALILFAFAWNDYLFALAFFVRDFKTLPLLVQSVGSPGPMGAASMITAMALPVIAALLAQRYLVRGLTLGAVKG
jgi:multiple sugar transport system permease protein